MRHSRGEASRTGIMAKGTTVIEATATMTAGVGTGAAERLRGRLNHLPRRGELQREGAPAWSPENTVQGPFRRPLVG
jgi:hypothetical protein